MNSDSCRNLLCPVNGLSDMTGRIRTQMTSHTPIFAIPCVWPEFPLLPPPMTSMAENEHKDQVCDPP